MDARIERAMSWKAHCLVCDEDFTYKDGFECKAQPGRHTIESETYYHLGAGHIQDIRERRKFAPALNLKANLEVRDKVTGQITQTEGIIVHFNPGGIYTTQNPEEQYYLAQHMGVTTGDEGRDAWDKMYLTPQQQLDKANTRLSDVQRRIREGNALLETVRTRQAPPPIPRIENAPSGEPRNT